MLEVARPTQIVYSNSRLHTADDYSAKQFVNDYAEMRERERLAFKNFDTLQLWFRRQVATGGCGAVMTGCDMSMRTYCRTPVTHTHHLYKVYLFTPSRITFKPSTTDDNNHKYLMSALKSLSSSSL